MNMTKQFLQSSRKFTKTQNEIIEQSIIRELIITKKRFLRLNREINVEIAQTFLRDKLFANACEKCKNDYFIFSICVARELAFKKIAFFVITIVKKRNVSLKNRISIRNKLSNNCILLLMFYKRREEKRNLETIHDESKTIRSRRIHCEWFWFWEYEHDCCWISHYSQTISYSKEYKLQTLIFRIRESWLFVTNTSFETKNRFSYAISQFVRINIFNRRLLNHDQYESLYNCHNRHRSREQRIRSSIQLHRIANDLTILTKNLWNLARNMQTQENQIEYNL